VRFTAASLCNAFGVTPELCRELNLKSIVPSVVRREREPLTRRLRRADFIKKYLTENPDTSQRQLAAICKENGFKVSAQTVGRVLKQFGLKRNAPGRRSGKISPMPVDCAHCPAGAVLDVPDSKAA